MTSPDLNHRAAAALARLVEQGRIKSPCLPGMLCTVGRLTFRCAYVGDDGGEEWVSGVYDAPDSAEYVTVGEYSSSGRLAPDLSDPLTVQALVLLAREAWGDNGIHVVKDTGRGRWAKANSAPVYIVRGTDGFDLETAASCRGDSEAEALVVALEAAAERGVE